MDAKCCGTVTQTERHRGSGAMQSGTEGKNLGDLTGLSRLDHCHGDRERRAILGASAMPSLQACLSRDAAVGSQSDARLTSAQEAETALDLVRMRPLVERTRGSPAVRIGLIDGPVDRDHPKFAAGDIRDVSSDSARGCSHASSDACRHGTLVAGVLHAARGSRAPAICPGCTLLTRAIFLETHSVNGSAPTASVEEVSTAIVETVDAGAIVLNLSIALAEPSSSAERRMHEALDYAARRSVLVVAAAGNQGTLGSTAITRHPWVIAVVACDTKGRPMRESNLSHSAGKRGLAAPGEGITSLAPDAKMQSFSGTSAAVPFVTGAIALLWSLFPTATANRLRFAITRAGAPRRTTLVPPLLDGLGAYRSMS